MEYPKVELEGHSSGYRSGQGYRASCPPIREQTFLACSRRKPMNTIHLRLDLRIEKDMYDFLQEEASLKKMSFEGLILNYIRQRMEQQRRNATGGGR